MTSASKTSPFSKVTLLTCGPRLVLMLLTPTPSAIFHAVLLADLLQRERNLMNATLRIKYAHIKINMRHDIV